MGVSEIKSSTLQISNLAATTSNESLEEAFSDFGPIKRCFVVRPRKEGAVKTIGYVQFAFPEDAAKAYSAKNGSIQIEGETAKLKAVPDKTGPGSQVKIKTEDGADEEEAPVVKDFKKIQEDIEYAKKKRARLIVRNLSFKADETSLKEHFEKCGKVEDVNILKKKDGKMVGCAFVQFSNITEASNAIKTLNGKPMLQRPIAVDWAVPKKEFEAKSDLAKPEIKLEDSQNESVVSVAEEIEEDEEEMEEDDDDEEEAESGEEEDEEAFDDDDDETKYRKSEKPKWESGHDVSENRTVFVRNLNFDSEQDDLHELMEQYFGKVFFAVMVRDKMTERPKGTAFIKFASPESAEKCIQASDTDGIFLDGRQIYATMALPKADADQKAQEKKAKEPKDTRNLFLAREGLIREGTQAATGVSKADLEKRTQLEKYKRQMLKNLTMFVSPVRLCIRNIPPTVSDKKLVAVIKKHSNDPEAKITEARIMKNLKDGGKSKGYAFVAFDRHESALNCLRKLNNNPKVFTKDARPIVDFSIENRKAIQAREKRQIKSVEKNPLTLKGDKTAALPGQKMKTKKLIPTQVDGDQDESEKPEFMGSASDPKIKTLPSHIGPKIRHNPKISRKALNKQDKDKKKNKNKKRKLGGGGDTQTQSSSQVEAHQGAPEAKKARKSVAPPKSAKKLQKLKKEQQAEKKFASLVQSYKNRIVNAESSSKKTKWFE